MVILLREDQDFMRRCDVEWFNSMIDLYKRKKPSNMLYVISLYEEELEKLK